MEKEGKYGAKQWFHIFISLGNSLSSGFTHRWTRRVLHSLNLYWGAHTCDASLLDVVLSCKYRCSTVNSGNLHVVTEAHPSMGSFSVFQTVGTDVFGF